MLALESMFLLALQVPHPPLQVPVLLRARTIIMEVTIHLFEVLYSANLALFISWTRSTVACFEEPPGAEDSTRTERVCEL